MCVLSHNLVCRRRNPAPPRLVLLTLLFLACSSASSSEDDEGEIALAEVRGVPMVEDERQQRYRVVVGRSGRGSRGSDGEAGGSRWRRDVDGGAKDRLQSQPPPSKAINATEDRSPSDGGGTAGNGGAALSKPAKVGQHKKQDRLSDLKIIDQLLRTYDRRATPTNKIGQPTEVGCELFIRSFGSISEKTMDYQVDLYLRQHWEDPRLNHKSIEAALDLNDPNLVKAIWKPEVYFPNAKEGEFQYVTVPNVLLRIKPNGQILYMLRLKMKFSCMMDLKKYPLDVQVCTMEVASFSKTTRELLLEWTKGGGAVELSSDLRLPQFSVDKVVTGHCENETSIIGNYSCLVARFYLPRSVGFHMVQSYIPTILIVVISWVSFWMDVDSVPGRTTLGVTTLLTVSSKSAGLNAETPQVSYVKAIDVWMGACTAFIFAALIEFTIVNYLWRKYKMGFALDYMRRRDDQRGSNPRANGRKRRLFDDDANTQTGTTTTPGAEVAAGGGGIVVGMGGDTAGVEDHVPLQPLQGDAGSVDGGDAKAGNGNNGGNDGSWEVQRLMHLQQLQQQQDNEDNGEDEDDGAGDGALAMQVARLKARPLSVGLKVDEACRVLFPLNFLCFNVLYWWYYLYYE